MNKLLTVAFLCYNFIGDDSVNNKVIIAIIAVLVTILGIIGVRKLLESDYNDDEMYTEITYTVPDSFEYDDNSYTKYYSYYMDSGYCSFYIDADDKDYYDGLKDWFNERIRFSLNDKVSDLTEVIINGNKMFYIDKKGKYGTEYYYGVESSNHYYLLIYTVYDRSNGDRSDYGTNICDTARDEIIKTVNVK